MTEVAAPDKIAEATPLDAARAECDRLAAEVGHLERQIATATWKASQLEVPGATPAPNELDDLYASIARWRSRLGALLVAQTTAKSKHDAAAAERLASMTTEIRAALQPFEDRKAGANAKAVTAAKAFAGALRELNQAETDRRGAILRVAPQRFSNGPHDAEQMADVQAMLPKVIESDEPLDRAVLAVALQPIGERPFWRQRADHLAKSAA